MVEFQGSGHIKAAGRNENKLASVVSIQGRMTELQEPLKLRRVFLSIRHTTNSCIAGKSSLACYESKTLVNS